MASRPKIARWEEMCIVGICSMVGYEGTKQKNRLLMTCHGFDEDVSGQGKLKDVQAKVTS